MYVFYCIGTVGNHCKNKKIMGIKADKLLTVFNNQAPVIVIISSLSFYIAVSFCSNERVWCAIIVLSFWECVWFTRLWYKREKAE